MAVPALARGVPELQLDPLAVDEDDGGLVGSAGGGVGRVLRAVLQPGQDLPLANVTVPHQEHLGRGVNTESGPATAK